MIPTKVRETSVLGRLVVVGLLLGLWGIWPGSFKYEGAVTAQESLPESLNDNPCIDCHYPEVVAGIGISAHQQIVIDGQGCAPCHGELKGHLETGSTKEITKFTPNSTTPIRQQNQTCLKCHSRGPGMFWQGSAHQQEDLACSTCHQIMAPADVPFSLKAKATHESAQKNLCFSCHPMQGLGQKRSTHLGRNGLECSACHNPHGGPGPGQLRESGITQQCLACHEDKRGPFLFEHPVVEDGCLGCHDPHASNQDSLLKVARPTLCLECHSQVDFFHEVKGIATRYVVNRGCQNCHGLIHGSNHPAGSRLQR